MACGVDAPVARASATAISICAPRDRHGYVLKIFDFGASPETMDCQLRVLRHVAEQDPTLPVPRLIRHARGRGDRPGQRPRRHLLDLSHGFPRRPLLADSPPDAPLARNVGETLARLDRALQGFFHPALGQRLAWDVRRLPELAEYLPYIESAAVRRTVESAALRHPKERMPALRALRSQAIHGDCHGQNLLVDAEAGVHQRHSGFRRHDSRAAHPGAGGGDVGAPDRGSGAARTRCRRCSRAMRGRQPLDGAEVDVLYDLIAARHAVTILVHAWRGRHDADGRAGSRHGRRQSAARSLEALDAGRRRDR